MNIESEIKIVWKEVEGVEHTVVSFLAREYAAFYKHEPAIQTVIDDTVKYVEIGLPIVLDATGEGALAPAVTSIVDEVFSDLKIVSSTVYDFGPSPDAASILSSVQSNLANLETAGHVKDPVKVAKLKLIVNAVGALAAVIAKAIEAAKAPAPTPAPAPVNVAA